MNQIRLLGAKTITFRQRIQGNKNALQRFVFFGCPCEDLLTIIHHPITIKTLCKNKCQD